MKNKLYLFLALLIIIGSGTAGYFGYQTYQLKKIKLALENELLQTQKDLSQTKADFVSTKKDLESMINLIEEELSNTKIERNDFAQKYNDEKNRMDSFSSQIEGIGDKVGILQRLSQTDPELLIKYSKVYFLNDNYIPRSFVKIPSKYTFDSQEDYLFYSEIWQFLQNLLADSENNGINIRIISAYRSFGEQNELKSSYSMIYGSGANQFSADQGYSEHQLGTTLDFTTLEIGESTYSFFDKTTAYLWLLENAYKYGFIPSYPEGNKYYQFEPWHWRFVGRALAGKLHQEGKYFYNLEQREIDQYLISFFD